MQNNDIDIVDDDEDGITFHPSSIPEGVKKTRSGSVPEVAEFSKHKAESKDLANLNRRRSEDSPVRFNSATPTLETVPEIQMTSSDGNDVVMTSSTTSLENADVPSTSKAFQLKASKKVRQK